MKTKSVLVAAMIGCLVAPFAKADLPSNTPVMIESNFINGYLPEGFDTNDSVEIVGEGLFVSSCYKPAHVDVKVDTTAMRIELRPRAYYYDSLCLQAIIPYHQVVNVGILPFGRYRVVDANRKEDLGVLNIRLATSSSADDFLYAPVSQAFFKQEAGKNFLTVSGTFTNSCMRLADVVANVQPKVITVQPIMEMTEGTLCADGMFPFEEKIEVHGLSAKQRYLVHVRSLNGKSINNLIDLE